MDRCLVLRYGPQLIPSLLGPVHSALISRSSPPRGPHSLGLLFTPLALGERSTAPVVIVVGRVEEVSQSPSGGVTGSPFWFTSSSKSIMYEERVCPSGWKALMHDKMEGGREGEVHSSSSPPQALNRHLLHRGGCFSFKDSYTSSFEGHNMRDH